MATDRDAEFTAFVTAYRTLTTTYIDERGRAWHCHERASAARTETVAAPVDSDTPAIVLAALEALPPRQRAVVVLRWLQRQGTVHARIRPGRLAGPGLERLVVLDLVHSDGQPDTVVESYRGKIVVSSRLTLPTGHVSSGEAAGPWPKSGRGRTAED